MSVGLYYSEPDKFCRTPLNNAWVNLLVAVIVVDVVVVAGGGVVGVGGDGGGVGGGGGVLLVLMLLVLFVLLEVLLLLLLLLVVVMVALLLWLLLLLHAQFREGRRERQTGHQLALFGDGSTSVHSHQRLQNAFSRLDILGQTL